MFYALAKIAALLLLPSAAGLLAAIIGLALLAFTRWNRIGMACAVAGVGLLTVAGVTPLSNMLIYPLEQRFAGVPLPKSGDGVAGIIILGGFESAGVTAARPGLALNESAERLTESVRLAHRWPKAKVVFTGGIAGLFPRGKDASSAIADYLVTAGIARDRIVLDGKARDTLENATFTNALVDPKPNEIWGLVTSAYHIPRAVGVFRAAGFNVVPVPVDFRTTGASDTVSFFDRPSRGLMRTDTVTKEWVGLLFYWLSGRSSALFPAPNMDPA